MSAAAPDVRNKVYLVTGASRGVGSAICKVLHARGARFAMLARSREELKANAEAFGDQGLPLACDVADLAAVKTAVAATVERFGGLDGVVNNAAVSRIAPVEQLGDADMLMMFRINVLGPLHTIQAALPHLRARGAGNIVNVSSSSVQDLSEFPYLGGYSATKAALERLTRELRVEASPDNIAVTLFNLGNVRTGFGGHWGDEVTTQAFEEWDRRGGAMPDPMEAEVAAEAIVRCLETPPGVCSEYIAFRPFLQISKQSTITPSVEVGKAATEPAD